MRSWYITRRILLDHPQIRVLVAWLSCAPDPPLIGEVVHIQKGEVEDVWAKDVAVMDRSER
jgi:hypothetical protein